MYEGDVKCQSNEVVAISDDEDDSSPKKPLRGARMSGSATSALMPQSTVVSPKRTRAEPSAEDIEPDGVQRCRPQLV